MTVKRLAAALGLSLMLACGVSVARQYNNGDGTISDGVRIESGQVGAFHVRAFTSFVRPANTTAYAVGQLVANSATAASVTPLAMTVGRVPGGTGLLRRAKLSKTSLTTTNASFRIHIYRNLPTPVNGDGAAWSTTSSVYLGAFDITMDRVFTDQVSGISTPLVGSEIMYDTAAGSQTIYALIEARGAYTPASGETFTLTLENWQD